MKYYLYLNVLGIFLIVPINSFVIDRNYLESFFHNYFENIRQQGFSNQQQCPITKAGANYGEATMFQEDWVHGKTGACGFERPSSSHGEGFFTAVGTEDWENGYSCGSCAELEYQGNIITVNVVDRCGACSKGWFDLGGPAWRALTNNMAPGHVYGVTSRWVTCPHSLTRGNIHVYVKPGSHAWDARFQPTQHIRPVTGMAIDGGNGWQNMAKCENFMFCKPSGITIHGQFGLRVTSDTGNIDVTVSGLQGDSYIDMGMNNDGGCSDNTGGSGINSTSPPPTASSTTSPPPPPSTTVWGGTSVVDCSMEDGLYPDPANCRGFIKCAQGDTYPMLCSSGLYFDPVTYNCNWPWATQCNGRPVF